MVSNTKAPMKRIGESAKMLVSQEFDGAPRELDTLIFSTASAIRFRPAESLPFVVVGGLTTRKFSIAAARRSMLSVFFCATVAI